MKRNTTDALGLRALSRIDADGGYHSPYVCFATEGPLTHDGSQTTAGADLSAKQFYAVKLSAARAVNLMAASTDDCYGILQNKPTSGQAADVGIFGVSKAIAGAAISAGAKLMANSSGKVITFVGGSANTLVGWAIEAASADTQIITIRLAPQPVIT